MGGQWGFEKRWRLLLNQWPDQIARAFRAHMHTITRKGGSSALPPFWIPLSHALARREGLPRHIAEDLLWATTCLSHAIRMEDDLLDGDTRADLSVFAAPLLYNETHRLLRGYFSSRSAFWESYRLSLHTTLLGIAGAAHSQRRQKCTPATLMRFYSMQCAIFNVPLFALCRLSGNRRILPRLRTAAHHLAIAGHMIDDLMDINEDLHDGRMNSAAAFLLGHLQEQCQTPGDIRARTAEALLFSPRLRNLFSCIHSRLTRANSALAILHLTGFDQYIRTYGSALRRWEEELQRSRGTLVVHFLRGCTTAGV